MTSSDKLFILLPPSESKALSGVAGTKFKETDGKFGKSLAKHRAEIIAALRKQNGGSQKLLGVSGTHLARAQQANLALRGAKTLRAHERYTGVVWDHLDLASLTSAQKKICRCEHHCCFWVAWLSLCWRCDTRLSTKNWGIT